MKGGILRALAMLVVWGTAATPAMASLTEVREAMPLELRLAEVKQLEELLVELKFDKNDDGLINGYDWNMMTVKEKERNAIHICGAKMKNILLMNGKEPTLNHEDGSIAMVKHLSPRVQFGLDLFYQRPKNLSVDVSEQALKLYWDELIYLDKLRK